MTACIINGQKNGENKIHHHLKIENEKLHDQNNKLINKLEQLSCEFSKSRNMIKTCDNVNSDSDINLIMERNKILEVDNKRLCEELKHQIIFNKVSEISDLQNSSSNCEETRFTSKNLHLKNQLQELRKQLLKTQQLAYKSECNFKLGQIETLEALKNCKLENDSLKEKNFELESKIKNVLHLHTENLKLKTVLCESQNDLKSIKVDFDNFKSKQIETTKIFDQEKKSLEKEFVIHKKKYDDLHKENEILLSTINELTKTELNLKPISCDECRKLSDELTKFQLEIKSKESELHQLNENKIAMEKDYLLQIDSLKQFEKEQCKLKEEIKVLNGIKLNFDSSLKIKMNEIDNLTCQMESYSQRLEVREQRINDLTAQLTAKTSDEENLISRLSIVKEKLDHMEIDVNKYQNDLSQAILEKKNLNKVVQNLESDLSGKVLLIDQLESRLYESVKSNEELKETLKSHLFNTDVKIRDYLSNIECLKNNVEESNYSINIYEKQNQTLKKELKETKLKLESALSNEVSLTKTHQLEIDRYEVKQMKNNEMMEAFQKDIEELNMKINELEIYKKETGKKLVEKENECLKISNYNKEIDDEMKNSKTQLVLLTEKMQDYQSNIETIHILKSKVTKKSEKIHSYKNNILELTKKIEEVNEEFHNEKSKCNTLESKLSTTENNLEKLKVKVLCTEENLDYKRKTLDNVISQHKIEYDLLLEKLHLVEKERDDSLCKFRINEEVVIRLNNELKRNKEELISLKETIIRMKEEICLKEKSNVKLEKKVVALHDHLKCSQLNVMDRSREIDRLEQLVRDRSEQIELRSNQLEEFEKNLESRLVESQKQIELMKQKEIVATVEIEKLTNKNKELSDSLLTANLETGKLSDLIKIKENECILAEDKVRKLEHQNKSLIHENDLLKKDLKSKSELINDLKIKFDARDKKIEKLTDELESKKTCVEGKNWQIRLLEEQIKKDKSNYIDTEANLQTEIKLLMKKLNSFNLEKKKEIDFIVKNMSKKFKGQLEEISSFKERIENLNNDLDEVNIKLFAKEEHISELKIHINTQSAVMIDIENNCRLKEAVIEKLIQKINDFTLINLSCEVKEQSNFKEIENSEELNKNLQLKNHCIYEEVSLEELLGRINVKLTKDKTSNER